jgi:hypothetical protein
MRCFRIAVLSLNSALQAIIATRKSFLMRMRTVREQTCRVTRSSCATFIQERQAFATVKHIHWRESLAKKFDS